MGNSWYRLSECLQRDNLVLYNELNKYYDYENNKYIFIVQLYNNGGTLLFNNKEIIEAIQLQIDIYNNNKTQAFINVYDACYYKTGVDIYAATDTSYDLVRNMNWFVNFSMENKVICIDNINHKFLDFLLKHIPDTLPLFKLLCYLKNIDQNKYI